MDLESLPIALPDGVGYEEYVIGTYLVSFPFLRNPGCIPHALRSDVSLTGGRWRATTVYRSR